MAKAGDAFNRRWRLVKLDEKGWHYLPRQDWPVPPSPVKKLSGNAWVPVAYKRGAKQLGPHAMNITEASEALAEASKTASDCAKPLKARYIEKLLRELGSHPLKPR